MSVMSKAYELADAIKASPEYLAYVKAKGEVERHEAARIMLRDLRQKQEKLEKARLAGEELKKEDIEDLRRTYEIVGFNPYIKELFQAEFKLMEMVGEVNKIIAEACGLASPRPQEKGVERQVPPAGDGGGGRE